MSDADRRNGHTLSALRRHAGPWLWLAIMTPLAGGAMLVVQAWIMSDVIGRAIEARQAASTLAPSVLVVLGLLLGRAALAGLGDHAGTAAAEAIKQRLRGALFGRLLASSPRRAEQPQAGAAAAAIVDQVETLDGFFARYLPAMIQAALLPLAFGAVILPLDRLAGLLFLVTAPLIPLFMALAGWGAQRATQRQARAMSLLAGRFGDRLRGMLTLKLFGRADAETAGIVRASDDLRRRTLRVLRIAFLSSAVLEFFAALGVAGIALYVGLTFIGFLDLRSSPLDLQLGLFLLLMATEVYNPLRLLAAHYHDRAAAKAAIAEIEAQLGALPASRTQLQNAPRPVQLAAPALVLEGVTLRTPDHARRVLGDVGLTVASGEHIAILGASGSGKSTLLETIAGLRAHEGLIALDGRPLAEWAESELRGRMAVLGQKPRIFAGSVAHNIALARPDATSGEVRRAAEMAHVSVFADALPDGLDTRLGEGGLGLSGGQAQRVALARIYLRDAGLILLDEPTAHLDRALEDQVMGDLLTYAKGRTLIIATHSLAVAAQVGKAWRVSGETLLPTPVPGRTGRVVA